MFHKEFSKWLFPSVMFLGYSKTINSQAVTVLQEDASQYPLLVRFNTAAITDGGAGYAGGCRHLKDNGNGTTSVYENQGDSASCDFNLIETVAQVVTGVTAGNGLTGGGTEGTLTLAVGAGYGTTVRADAVDVGVNVYNTLGVLAKGTLVNLSGFTGTLGVTMTLADADAGVQATHVVADVIANNTAGVVYPVATVVGTATDVLNTNGLTIGNLVYLSAATSGGWTVTPSTGSDQLSQVVGIVKVVSATVGEIAFFPGAQRILKLPKTMLQDQAVDGNKLDSGMFQNFSGVAKDGNNILAAIRIYNQTGGTLTKGTLVRLLGFDTTLGATVAKADADADAPASFVVVSDINNTQSGYVAPIALLTNQNTNGRAIGDPIYLDATTAGGWTAAAPTGADQITQVVGYVKVVDVANGEIVFTPGINRIIRFGTSFVRDASLTPAKDSLSKALTATADGLTTGLLTGGTRHYVVTSNAATDAITLPASSAALIGQTFKIWVGANGFELLTPASSGATVNGTDCDGTNQADIPANSFSEVTLVDTNTWILANTLANGTVSAAIVPDND